MGDVLRLSGFLVNPLEIETHIQKLPGIADCQTIAVPRPDGVRAVSFVILQPGTALDEAAIIAHCKRGLANYKVPLRVFAIDDFPKTPSPNGFKIQRAGCARWPPSGWASRSGRKRTAPQQRTRSEPRATQRKAMAAPGSRARDWTDRSARSGPARRINRCTVCSARSRAPATSGPNATREP